jgi:hypothetical protein
MERPSAPRQQASERERGTTFLRLGALLQGGEDALFVFKRGINEDFVERLNAEYKRGGWWQAMASDPSLFIAMRDGYVNVYYSGNSLLKLTLDGERLAGEIHYKYLLRPDMPKLYVPVDGGKVKLTDAAAYLRADLSDVSALKRVAAVYGGEEKGGVHQIVLDNPCVVDVEIAFGLGGSDKTAPATRRIDFAALRPAPNGAEVVFYEAKLFDNKELRASGDNMPPVIEQIEGYRKLLVEHAADIAKSYKAVCANLLALKGVKERYAAASDLLAGVASSEMALYVSNEVRLAVFGYDADQEKGEVWAKHRKKLDNALGQKLLLKGGSKDCKLR